MNGITRLPYRGTGLLTLYYSVYSDEPTCGPGSRLHDYDKFYYRKLGNGKYQDLTVYFDAFSYTYDEYFWEFDSAIIYADYICDRRIDDYLLDDELIDKIIPLCPGNSTEYREALQKRLTKRAASLLLVAHKSGDQELVNALLPDFSKI